MGCVRDTRAYKCHMAAEIVFVRACGCNLSLSFTALLCEIRALKSLGQPYTQHGAHQSDQICTYRLGTHRLIYTRIEKLYRT